MGGGEVWVAAGTYPEGIVMHDERFGSLISFDFASVAVPEMDRYNYDKKLSTGIVATVGTLGILIPPSVTLIVFGIITELSIGRLFLAGIIPGLMIAFFFIVINEQALC